MTFAEFKSRAKPFTLAQLRCDERPGEELLELLTDAGADAERFVDQIDR